MVVLGVYWGGLREREERGRGGVEWRVAHGEVETGDAQVGQVEKGAGGGGWEDADSRGQGGVAGYLGEGIGEGSGVDIY